MNVLASNCVEKAHHKLWNMNKTIHHMCISRFRGKEYNLVLPVHT